MELSYEDALKRLTGGEALDSLLLSTRPDSDVSLQRRAALVRSFDRETFRHLAPDGDFDAFIKQPFVTAVPGTSGSFRIRDDHRRTLLSGWVGTDEWRSANADLAVYFSIRKPGGSVDELCHLSALGSAREDAASRIFAQLFDQADARFELAKCAELLEVVADPSHRHSETFLDVVKTRRCRLRARQLWSEEFFRTTAYHERKSLVDGFEALRTDPQKWILQIYAGGGMGKTMFVRWLLSRHLVPKGIPCARLDFDFEQPSWLSQRPWRLVLKIARQLNEQMPEGPFSELITEYTDAEAEEDIASADATQDLERAQSNDLRFNPEAFSRFTSSLLDAKSAAPVIVFDTLERVSLYYQTDLLELIGRFAAVHADYPALRLILAGRYDLGSLDTDGREHIPGFTAQSGGQTVGLPVKPFSEPEAREYLTTRRGIDGEGHVNAIIDRSGGVPFKLSLFATIVQDDPTLDETAIRQMKNVNVEFLIKRVVDQIKEPLAKWVLRHGIVPRQLTRAFLRDVMIPLLQEIQQGLTAADTGKDQLPDHLRDDERFKIGLLQSPAETIDADKMWTTLNRYASDYSWISQSKDWPDTLVFHADVVDAMRTLLQEHEAFNRLHEAAVRYYETRALSDAANWTRWTREAIYHRFQRGGADAAAQWLTALDRAATHGAAARRDVAQEILGSEYVDEAGAPRSRSDGTPMVPLDVLVTANYEAARAGVETARLRRAVAGDQAWFTADRRIKAALRLEQTLPASVVPPTGVVMVTAAIELTRKPEDALKMLEAARTDVTPDFVSEFEELQGDAIRPTDVVAAARHFQAALDRAGDDAMLTPRVRSLAAKLVEMSAKTGAFDVAASIAARLLAAGETAADAEIAGIARVLLVSALGRAGAIREAIDVCGEDRAGGPPLSEMMQAMLDSVEAWAWTKASDPLRAWRLAAGKFPRAFEGHVDSELTVRDALGLQLKGDLHVKFFEFEDALSAWRDARHAWDVIHDPASALGCVLRSVRMMVRHTRELAAAAQLMSEAERMSASLGPQASFEYRVVEAERLADVEPEPAKVILDTILDAPGAAATYEPASRAGFAKLAISLGHRVHDARALLRSTLEQVTPPSGRLWVLNPRDSEVAPFDLAAAELGAVVLPAVEAIQKGKKGVSAFVLDALEALRWVGETKRARSLSRQLDERLDDNKSLFALLALREVLRRLNLDRDADGLNAPSIGRRFLKEFRDRPRVCGVFLLSETEIRIARDGWRPTKVRLKEIDRYLGDRASLPASLKARVDLVNEASAKRKASARPSAPQPTGEVTLGQPTVAVAFGRRENRSVVTRPGGPPEERSIEDAFKALIGDSFEKLTKMGFAAPVNLDMRLSRDSKVPAAIGRLLFDEAFLNDLPNAVDLRIETGHSIYGGIPWELARMPDGALLVAHKKIRCVYRCVSTALSTLYTTRAAQAALVSAKEATLAVDGILGPKTSASFRDFQRKQGLPVSGDLNAATYAAIVALQRDENPWDGKTVVILRRGHRAQVTQTRGIAFSTFDVADEYKRAGWRVVTLEDPSEATIEDAVAETRACVCISTCRSRRLPEPVVCISTSDAASTSQPPRRNPAWRSGALRD